MSAQQMMMQSQSRAFQKWVNFRLMPVGKKCNDMRQDWRDGCVCACRRTQPVDVFVLWYPCFVVVESVVGKYRVT